jgi:hypothetical protein
VAGGWQVAEYAAAKLSLNIEVEFNNMGEGGSDIILDPVKVRRAIRGTLWVAPTWERITSPRFVRVKMCLC